MACGRNAKAIQIANAARKKLPVSHRTALGNSSALWRNCRSAVDKTHRWVRPACLQTVTPVYWRTPPPYFLTGLMIVWKNRTASVNGTFHHWIPCHSFVQHVQTCLGYPVIFGMLESRAPLGNVLLSPGYPLFPHNMLISITKS